MIDQPRYSEWVKLSHRLSRFEQFMIVAVQGLGQIDAKLAAQDRAFLALPEKERKSNFQVSLDLTERFTLSYLWVLGTYEIVRSVDQRCRENTSLASSQIQDRVRDSKRLFERVRIPLAKFEAASRHAATDSTVAFPAIDRTHGIAWHIAAGTFITREELAQNFLHLLQALPA
jgi:hypothetical protein